MRALPKNPLEKEKIFEKLKIMGRNDIDPKMGKLFSHIYETGIRELKEVALYAYMQYMDKTMLNFTVYPSILNLENEVVSMTASLLNGDKNVVGSFTYGGTESIFLAVKSARDYFYDEKGKSGIPEIILTTTTHPAFYKAAHLLGLRTKIVKLNPASYKIDLNETAEAINSQTALIVGSAPNYPYGTVDDIEGLAQIATDNKIWFHVDACIGGFVLPFFKRLGLNIPSFDFEVEGVTSISVDLHKYGYCPKGGSIILYRNKKYRIHQLYVNASWPGYPLVNTTLLSTRSAAPLAAAWAVLNYLGENGYLKLAEKILKAKKILINGLNNLGFHILGNPESSIIAFSSDEINLSILSDFMKKKGWYLQVQPGNKYLGFSPSIHLTLSPIHEELAEVFLKDIGGIYNFVKSKELPKLNEIVNKIGEIYSSDREKGIDVLEIMNLIGLGGENTFENMALINMLIHELPPNLVEYLFKLVVNELFVYRD